MANNFAFIDSQNVHLGIKAQGWLLDWKRFRRYLRHKLDVTEAFIFIGYVPGNERLYASLQRAGYILIFKPIVTVRENGRTLIKGNVDAELVLHTMIQYENFDQSIIVTSDGDFACLVEYLLQKKKLKRVMSSHSSTCSVLIRRAAKNCLVYMHPLRAKLEYKKDEGPLRDETTSAGPRHRNSNSS